MPMFSSDEREIIRQLDLLVRARTRLGDGLAADFAARLEASIERFAVKKGLAASYVSERPAPNMHAQDGRDLSSTSQVELSPCGDWRETACVPFLRLQGRAGYPPLRLDFRQPTCVEMTLSFQSFAVRQRSREKAKDLLEENRLLPSAGAHPAWTEDLGDVVRRRFDSQWDYVCQPSPPNVFEGLASRSLPKLELLWPELAWAIESYAELVRRFDTLKSRHRAKLMRSKGKLASSSGTRNVRISRRRFSSEEAFLMREIPTLAWIEAIWRDSRAARFAGSVADEQRDDGLAQATMNRLGEMLRIRVDEAGLSPANLKSNRLRLKQNAHTDLGMTPECWLFSADKPRPSPLLAFRQDQSDLLRGTVCAIIDLRPWIKGHFRGSIEDAKKLVTGVRSAAGPEWLFKGANTVGAFYGWWTRPGTLELNMRALADNDRSAVACIKGVLDLYIEICRRLDLIR